MEESERREVSTSWRRDDSGAANQGIMPGDSKGTGEPALGPTSVARAAEKNWIGLGACCSAQFAGQGGSALCFSRNPTEGWGTAGPWGASKDDAWAAMSPTGEYSTAPDVQYAVRDEALPGTGIEVSLQYLPYAMAEATVQYKTPQVSPTDQIRGPLYVRCDRKAPLSFCGLCTLLYHRNTTMEVTGGMADVAARRHP
nr:hypothetical protein CFP56_24465 [Quercus suber]